jgi:hypothetical protein
MQTILRPEVLDPDRLLVNDRGDFTADHETRAVLLAKALHESCEYAHQLWDTLNATRQYLLTSLPHDAITSAAPTGSDDEQRWQHWTEAFAAVTSVLCGPHGDSGFELGRANDEARQRRAGSGQDLATKTELGARS